MIANQARGAIAQIEAGNLTGVRDVLGAVQATGAAAAPVGQGRQFTSLEGALQDIIRDLALAGGGGGGGAGAGPTPGVGDQPAGSNRAAQGFGGLEAA